MNKQADALEGSEGLTVHYLNRAEAAEAKVIELRNTIVGLRNALEFVDYHISRDNTEAKEAIRIAVRSAKEAEK